MPPKSGGTSWTYKTLYEFQGGADGANPRTPVVRNPKTGILYGVTSSGGVDTGPNCGPSAENGGCGTVFEVVLPGKGKPNWTETVIYTFSGGADGGLPAGGLLLDKSGVLYGTAAFGGVNIAHGLGVVFKLTPPASGQSSWTESVLWSFQNSRSDGAYPLAGVVQSPDGSLYGTTQDGGGLGKGTVFKLVPPPIGQTVWSEKILHSFHRTPDGQNPQAPLLLTKAGDLLGTASRGGAGVGVVFEVPR